MYKKNILTQVELHKMSVNEAYDILYDSVNIEKPKKSKKIKVIVNTESTRIPIPSVRFGFLKFMGKAGIRYGLNKSDTDLGKKDAYKILDSVINHLKKCPPMKLVDIRTSDGEIISIELK